VLKRNTNPKNNNIQEMNSISEEGSRDNIMNNSGSDDELKDS
jgi:hypothetical protein